jgi:glycosyltransferase involved in cell wall biosynthesis
MLAAERAVAVSRRRPRRRRRHDVVFYTPSIGAILSGGRSLPPGGAETQILMLARQLAARGVRAAIVAYGSSGVLPEQVDGVRIVRRSSYVRSPRLVGKLIEVVRIWHSLWRAPSDTVVYRCAGLELGLVALYTRLAGRRLVHSSANVVDFDFAKLCPKRRDQRLYELGIRLADEIVVQTEEQVDLCRRTFGRESVLIKSLAAPAEPQRERPEAFLWIGRLVDYKGPLEYVALARAVPEARFWMVGVPGVAEPERLLAAEVRAAAAGVPNLTLLDPRPHGEIQALMGGVVASVNTAAFEGMPNVLLEAWAQGVPALVLHHDPDGVIARHALGGYAAGSPERLATLARELWEMREDRPGLAARCRSYVAESHGPQAVAEQWIEVLRVTDGARREAHAEHKPESVCAA